MERFVRALESCFWEKGGGHGGLVGGRVVPLSLSLGVCSNLVCCFLGAELD